MSAPDEQHERITHIRGHYPVQAPSARLLEPSRRCVSGSHHFSSAQFMHAETVWRKSDHWRDQTYPLWTSRSASEGFRPSG